MGKLENLDSGWHTDRMTLFRRPVVAVPRPFWQVCFWTTRRAHSFDQSC